MPNAIAKAKKGVRRTARELRRDRMRDYRQAADTVDALYDNLSRQLGRSGRRLDKASARTLERMRALQRRAKAGERAVGRAEERTTERYGTALAGAIEDRFAVGRAEGAAATRDAAAAVKTAKQQGRTVGELVELAQAGAEEARAAADYELANALAMRTRDDLQLVAQQRHDIAMMKLQQQLSTSAMEKQKALDFDYWKKQQDYLAKLAGPQMQTETLAIADRMSELVPYMHLYFTKVNPEGSTDELLTYLTDEVGLQDTERQTVLMLAKTMSSYGILRGTSPEGYATSVDAVMDVIEKLWPDINKKTGKTLRETILAGIRFTWNSLTAQANEPANPPDVTGGYNEPPSAADPYAGTINSKDWANLFQLSP